MKSIFLFVFAITFACSNSSKDIVASPAPVIGGGQFYGGNCHYYGSLVCDMNLTVTSIAKERVAKKS